MKEHSELLQEFLTNFIPSIINGSAPQFSESQIIALKLFARWLDGNLTPRQIQSTDQAGADIIQVVTIQKVT